MSETEFAHDDYDPDRIVFLRHSSAEQILEEGSGLGLVAQPDGEGSLDFCHIRIIITADPVNGEGEME